MFTLTLVTSLILESSGSAQLLAFHAEWAAPCRVMVPVVDRLKKAGYPVKGVDFDRDRELARRHSVNRIPAYVMLVDGREVGRVEGVTTFERLRAMFTCARSKPRARDEPLSPSTLEVGDVVQLKSGGPPMTIAGRLDQSFRCIWFDRSLQVKDRWFPAATLSLLPSPGVR